MGRWLDRLAALEGEDSDQQPAPGNVTPITPAAPVTADEAAIDHAMRRAVLGIPITPQEFRDCLDDDEAAWCATGRIPLKSARRYALLFARELAQDPEHPANDGKVTCWACPHFSATRCARGRRASLDEWTRCNDYAGRKA